MEIVEFTVRTSELHDPGLCIAVNLSPVAHQRNALTATALPGPPRSIPPNHVQLIGVFSEHPSTRILTLRISIADYNAASSAAHEQNGRLLQRKSEKVALAEAVVQDAETLLSEREAISGLL